MLAQHSKLNIYYIAIHDVEIGIGAQGKNNTCMQKENIVKNAWTYTR
jgi:hypothetical protein